MRVYALLILCDPCTPADIRLAAIREAKYRGLRNLQKRRER